MNRPPSTVLFLVAWLFVVSLPSDVGAAVVNFTTPDLALAWCPGHIGATGTGAMLLYREDGVTIKMGSTFANKGFQCLVLDNNELQPIVNTVNYGPLQSFFGDQGPPFDISSQFEITRVRIDFRSGTLPGDPCVSFQLGPVAITCSFTGDVVFADYGITNLTKFTTYYFGGSGNAGTRAFISEIEVPEPALVSLLAMGGLATLRRRRIR